jgi:hypothetical protein
MQVDHSQSGSRCSSRKSRHIENEGLFEIARQWLRCARAEGDRLHELTRSGLRFRFFQQSDHRLDALLEGSKRIVGGRFLEKPEERWFVDEQTTEKVGSLRGEAKSDRSAGRVAEDVSGGQVKLFNQNGQVGYILAHAPLPVGSLALTVAPPIIREDSKRPCKPRRNSIPAVVVSPGAVDQHDWIATLTAQLPG